MTNTRRRGFVVFLWFVCCGAFGIGAGQYWALRHNPFTGLEIGLCAGCLCCLGGVALADWMAARKGGGERG